MPPPAPHTVHVRSKGIECSFETGKIARQATAAVVGRSGDNVVLATIVATAEPKPGQSFFPLTVEYREKFAGAGRIPGNFMRREGRISDHEVLVSRLIDRTLRSLFPEDYRCEVQVQVQVMSSEPTSDIESLSLLTAACALHISPIPAKGPAGGLRVARVQGQLIPFPSAAQLELADLEITVGLGPDGPVMIECEADEVLEADCLLLLAEATTVVQKFQLAFTELAGHIGTVKLPVPAAALLPAVPDATIESLRAALQITEKPARRAAITAARSAWLPTLNEHERDKAKAAYELATWTQMRDLVLSTRSRLDGRGPADIRMIWSETGFLPRAHGSA
ncbi:MAG: polyribonucleotide nucleotidyltransferase, partial [Planctomycetota bacterium]